MVLSQPYTKSSASNTEVCVISNDSFVTQIDLQPVVSGIIANNAYGTAYYVQPLIVYGKQTPIYTVFGSPTILAPLSEFTVSGKTFMVIAKGLCIDITG